MAREDSQDTLVSELEEWLSEGDKEANDGVDDPEKVESTGEEV